MKIWIPGWRNALIENLPKTFSVLGEGYQRRDLIPDIIAGLTVGIVALPLAMAFAIASGLPPERGLYTAVVAGFLISFFSGSRFQIGGPTGAFVVIVFGVVSRHGYEGLVITTLISGFLLIAMGLFGFGKMIKFIPYPVTTGFTSGIALVIFSTQMKDFFGLQMDVVPSEFIDKWAAYFRHAGTIDVATTAVSLSSLGIIIFFRKYSPRIPGPIMGVILSSLAVYIFQIPIETIGSRFGEIPGSLPAPSFPEIKIARIRELFPDAVTITLLAAIESLLCAVVADGMTGRKHRSNTELVAQGLANIGSAVFGGIPATGALARTATSIKSGAKTPLAGMIHAFTLFIIMFFAAPLAKHIPLASLSAVLVIVAWNMSEVDHFKHLFRAPGGDVFVLLTTFFLTFLVDLTVAVQVGIVLAAILFMRRMSEVTEIGDIQGLLHEEIALGAASQIISEEKVSPERKLPEKTEIYEINGPFFFGMADRLKDTLKNFTKTPVAFILRMRNVPVIDATALHALEEFYNKCRKQNTTLILSGVRDNVRVSIRKMGLEEKIGTENIISDFDSAIARATEIVERESL